MVVEKNLRVTINFYKKQCLPVIASNKKHLLKQVVPITYALERRFFAAAILLKVLDRVKKVEHTSVFMSFLRISRKKMTKWILFMKSTFIFSLQIVSLICLCNFSWKIAVQNANCVFANFCGGYKYNFWLQFGGSFKCTEAACVEKVTGIKKCFRLKDMIELKIFWSFLPIWTCFGSIV